jgi:hypothetical protein
VESSTGSASSLHTFPGATTSALCIGLL